MITRSELTDLHLQLAGDDALGDASYLAEFEAHGANRGVIYQKIVYTYKLPYVKLRLLFFHFLY